jgi:alkylation response protein AidB-like acyl-CoA dehydrogenase
MGAVVAALFAEDAVARDAAGGKPLEQLRLLKESGLLKLHIPAEFGGAGQPWSKVLRIGRAFAKVDGSFGHLYGYHFGALDGACIHGSAQQREQIYTESARNNWFWGNSGNSFSHSLFGRREGEHYVLNGHRPFSSGTHIADRITIAWEDEVTDERTFAAIPADREGVTILDDWDGIGQTQTGSGTVTFRDVRIHQSDVLDGRQNQGQPFAALTPLVQQSVLLNVFIGSAQGALEEARTYTNTKSRPWVYSGYERHVDDPWVQRTYGDLHIKVEAATLLADKALEALDQAWARGRDLRAEERGAAAVTIASANVFAGNVALDVTSTIFEVMGARSATKANGFDRFWRNVRIHTLHNPAEYKARTVGTWFLEGKFPEPGTFR